MSYGAKALARLAFRLAHLVNRHRNSACGHCALRDDMEQSEKNIHFNDIALADIAQINVEVIARGDYPLAYRNLARSLEKRFDTALLRWRRGESPVADMKAALAISGEMLAAIANWQLDDETLIGKGGAWSLVGYMVYLLDQQVELPGDRLIRIREVRSQHADVALDYHILDAIAGREWRDGLAETLVRLAAKKRQMLAVETYRTYFSLLEAEGREEKVEGLVKAAEVNYQKRTRDGFYGGGPTYMGGGPDNPYVVDFVLAAILKRIGWTGETVHKWTWGM